MRGPYTQEIIVTIIFVLVLVLLLNPLGLFMPDKLLHIMLGGIVVLFFLYIYFILRDIPHDERERAHRFLANRTAYVFGSALLVLGIIYQGLTQAHIDPWLLYVLGVMSIAKVISLLNSERNN